MKTYYYYLRDEDNHPRITICLIRPACGFGDKYHRGISMCSYSEKKIDKAYGRKKAYSRAVHALNTGKDSMPVASFKAVDIIMRANKSLSSETRKKFPIRIFANSSFGNGSFKSQYNVTLTSFEKKLVG